MDMKNGFMGTVGNTPLIRLDSFSEATGCEILGKGGNRRLVSYGATCR